MKLAAWCGLLIAILAAAALAQAQPGPASGEAAKAQLSAAARQAVVAQIATDLREDYVDPVVGAKTADLLLFNVQSGAYDKLTDPSQFASRLNADLYASAHAEHMHVLVPGPPSPSQLPPNEDRVVRADRLRGGIGYIEVIGFPPMELFKPTIDRAMTALAGSKAIIMDVRLNGGGDSKSEAYLASFFTPRGKPIHIDELVMRKLGTDAFTREAIDSQSTPVSFSGRPVYILTSHDTFSAGEGLAYNLRVLKLATIVGEVTAAGGEIRAGNPNFPPAGAPLPSNLAVTIPSLRSENPTTKSNWEAYGVRPDIEVPASEALGTAMAKLGVPGALNIASASVQQVFRPRKTPAPGSEEALRHILPGLLANTPDYASMTCGLADMIRAVQPKGHDQRPALGPLKSIRFQQFDGLDDEYDVTFASSTLRYGVALAPDGKVCELGYWGAVHSEKPVAAKPG